MATIAFGLTCLGCLLLSLSLRRHYRQVFPDSVHYEHHRWPLRLAGYGCVALALWPSLHASVGWGIGVSLWVSLVALAAFTQAVLLTWRPRATPAFGALGLALVASGLLL